MEGQVEPFRGRWTNSSFKNNFFKSCGLGREDNNTHISSKDVKNKCANLGCTAALPFQRPLHLRTLKTKCAKLGCKQFGDSENTEDRQNYIH